MITTSSCNARTLCIIVLRTTAGYFKQGVDIAYNVELAAASVATLVLKYFCCVTLCGALPSQIRALHLSLIICVCYDPSSDARYCPFASACYPAVSPSPIRQVLSNTPIHAISLNHENTASAGSFIKVSTLFEVEPSPRPCAIRSFIFRLWPRVRRFPGQRVAVCSRRQKAKALEQVYSAD
jgi:hypothetical protein